MSYTQAELDGYRPFALLTAETLDTQRAGVGVSTYSGTIAIDFEQSRPLVGTDEVNAAAFRDKIGDIIKELNELAEPGGYMVIRDIRIDEEGVYFSDDNSSRETGPIMGCKILVDWGYTS